MRHRGITLHILTDANIQLRAEGISRAIETGETVEYEFVGPKACVQMLRAAFTRYGKQVPSFRGLLSPLHAVTVPDEKRAELGVPPSARWFAFAYPITGGGGPLERFSLATEPWLYFFICGGFVYFGDEGIVRVNSLTLTVAKVQLLRFSGQYPAMQPSVRALRAQGRLQPVSFDALLQAGHAEFGWVLPDERFDGHAIGVECAYEYGAFVYVLRDGTAVYYVLELREPDEPSSEQARFSAMLENFGRQHNDSELHTQGVRRQRTLERATSRAPPSMCAHVLTALLLPLMTVVLVMSCVSALVVLARYHRIAYETVSTFVWYSLFAVIVGIPVQDTAAVTITRARRVVFRRVQVALPMLFAVLLLTLRFVILGRDVVHGHAVVGHLAMHVIGVALPLLLYALRVRQARKLKRMAETVGKLGPGLLGAAIAWQGRKPRTLGVRRLASAISTRMLWRMGKPPAPPKASPQRRLLPQVPRLSIGGKRSSEEGMQVALSSPVTHTETLVGGVELGSVDMGSVDLAMTEMSHGCEHTGDSARGDQSYDAPPSVLPRRAAAQRAALLRARGANAARGASLRCAAPLAASRPAAPSCAAFPDGIAGVTIAASAATALREALRKPREARRRADAALVIQTIWRRLRAQAAYETELRQRQRRLLSFSWPIFFATLLNLVGNSIISHAQAAGLPLQSTGRHLGWLLLLLPCVFVIVRDLASPSPPRFSITHCIFFVAVLFPSTYNVVEFDTWMYNVLVDTLAGESAGVIRVGGNRFSAATLAPSVGLLVHLIIMLALLTLAKQTLKLVAAANTRAYFLFPLQFFDSLWVATFFNLRSITKRTPLSWVLMQLLGSIFTFCRNSGIEYAFWVTLLPRWLGRLRTRCRRRRSRATTARAAYPSSTPSTTPSELATVAQTNTPTEGSGRADAQGVLPPPRCLKERNDNTDPVWVLQYLARVGMQYELADLCAIGCTPLLVWVFVWRGDGWVSLVGTGLLVRECDLANLGVRCAILLAIRLAVNLLARWRVTIAMRATLLGKRTLHGISDLAARVAASRSLDSSYAAARVVSMRLGAAKRGISIEDDEYESIRRELSLKNLQHFHLWTSMLRRNYGFYVCVIAFEIFAAYPVARQAPYDGAPSATYIEWLLNGTAATWIDRAAVNETVSLPYQMVWLYVEPAVALDLDTRLQDVFELEGGCAAWDNASHLHYLG